MSATAPGPDALAPVVASTEPSPPAPAGARQSSLLDWAYKEYARRREAGEAVDRNSFCRAFPTIENQLQELISVHRIVHEDPHAFDAPTIVWPVPGETFLGFRLERELGRGSFSRVFLATEPALGNRRVVVKVSTLGAAEAQTLGRLAHPHIVPVFSVRADETARLAAVCMPYLGEATLRDLLDAVRASRGLAGRAAVIRDVAGGPAGGCPGSRADDPLRGCYADGIHYLAARLLDALAFMHQEGVLHRDLKPSNVLLASGGVPMLLDLNLCRDERLGAAPFGGTPWYMAPEQLRLLGTTAVETALDGRADLFSLGVILYELLTGEHPFGPPPPGATLGEMRRVLLERQQAGARPVRQHNAAIDPRLAELVDRCLAFAAEDRPSSATAAGRLLGSPARRTRRRGLVVTAGLVVLVVGIGLAIAGSIAGMRPSAAERGRRAYAAGDYGAAVRHLSDSIHDDATDADLWFLRGAAHLRLGAAEPGFLADAAADFARANQLRPAARTEAYLGYVWHLRKSLIDARQHYEAALSANFATPGLLNNLGCVCLDKGDLSRAEAYLTRAIELDGQAAAPYHNRGLVCLKRATATPRVSRLAKQAAGAAAPGRDVWLRRGLDDLVRAINHGAPAGKLYLDAATLCALLAPQDHRRGAQAIDYLELAIERGLDPRRLEQEPFRTNLGSDPRFSALLQRRPGAPEAFAVSRLLPISAD